MIDPVALFTEFDTDPTTIGYTPGAVGVTFNDRFRPTGDREAPDDALKSINSFRTTIDVQISTRPGPGRILQATIPMQMVRNVFRIDQWRANLDDPLASKDIELFKLLTAGGEDWLANDENISKMRQILATPRWGKDVHGEDATAGQNTRQNFEDLLMVKGSRAEQLWGVEVTRADMDAAEKVAESNGKTLGPKQ